MPIDLISQRLKYQVKSNFKILRRLIILIRLIRGQEKYIGARPIRSAMTMKPLDRLVRELIIRLEPMSVSLICRLTGKG